MSASLSSLVYNLSEINKKESINQLIKKFLNIYKFYQYINLNTFPLLLRKGVYPHEYMDSWEKLNEVSLPDEKSFYSNLNLESITDEDYAHAQNAWKVFKITNLGEYHDLYVQSDTLLLANVFENFRGGCINTYKLDPAHFLSAPWLVWHACLIKAGVKLELFTDNDIPAGIRCLWEISIRSPLRETSQRPFRNISKEMTFLRRL